VGANRCEACGECARGGRRSTVAFQVERSPNNIAVCEPFHGTVLHQFYRPHLHRGRVEDAAPLDRSVQAWVVDYNNARPNNGYYTAGRIP
jgi:hypothetical protein